MSHALHPELEQALASRPDDAAACSVYADWLTEQGDPRGELMTLELLRRRMARDARAEVDRRTAELLFRHREHFLGPLAERLDVLSLEWKHGFIRRANLTVTADYDDPETVGALVTELLGHPSARLLRGLTLAPLRAADLDEDLDYTPAIETVVAHAPESLTSLSLECLLRGAAIVALGGRRWPALEALSLTFAEAEGDHEAKALVSLVGACPALARLSLTSCPYGEDIAARNRRQPLRTGLQISLDAPLEPTMADALENGDVDLLDLKPGDDAIEFDHNGLPVLDDEEDEAWQDSDPAPTWADVGLAVEEYRDDPCEDESPFEPYREDDPDAEVEF
jgi:uncharacterized protein (TIGR02996 family)